MTASNVSSDMLNATVRAPQRALDGRKREERRTVARPPALRTQAGVGLPPHPPGGVLRAAHVLANIQ